MPEERTLAHRKPFRLPIGGTCCAISRMCCGDSWIAILGKLPRPGSRQFPERTPRLSQCELPESPPTAAKAIRFYRDARRAHFTTKSTFSTSKESPSGRLLASWKWIERRSSAICGRLLILNDRDLVAGRRLIRFEWCCGSDGEQDAETRRSSIVNWSRQVLRAHTTWSGVVSANGGRILLSPTLSLPRRNHRCDARQAVVSLGCSRATRLTSLHTSQR